MEDGERNAPAESGISNNDAKYNNIEGSAPSADGSTTEKLESSQAMEASAKAAQDAAEDAMDAVQDVLDAAQEAVDKAGEADDAAKDGNAAVNDAKSAGKAAAETATTAKKTETSLEGHVNDYNKDVADAQDEIDAAGKKIDLSETAEGEEKSELAQKLDKLDEDKEKAEALKEAALEGLGKTLDADGEERKEAAAEVQELANQANVLCWQAGKHLEAAEDTLNAAIDEYNTKAMLYGLPLYGTDENGNPYTEENPGYDDAKLEELGLKEQAEAIKAAKETMKEEYDAIQNADVSGSSQAIDKAEAAYNSAAETYSEAKDAAEAAKDAAEAAQEIVEAAAKDAADEQDDTLNYYKNIAQDEVDDVTNRIAENDAALWEARQKQSDAQSAYDAAAAKAAEAAEAQYNAELSKKEADKNTEYNNYLKAKKAYEDCSGWKIFEKVEKYNKYREAERAYEAAQKAYDSYNTAATKNSLIKEAQQSTSEYAELQAAKKNTEKYQNTADALSTEKAAKDAEFAKRTAEVEDITNTYLKELQDLEAETRQSMVDAVKKDIVGLSDNINQVEFDKALNEWANEVFAGSIDWSDGLFGGLSQGVDNLYDAHVLRDYMDDEYNTGRLREIFNTFGLTQWAVGTGKTEKVMDEVIRAYREGLRQCEEKQANMEAEIARLNAEAAMGAGGDAIKVAGEANITDLTSAETAAATILDARNQVSEAEKTLAQVKEDAQDFYNLSSIDLQDLLNKIAVAEQAVADAKATLDEITVIKRNINRYSGYAKSYADYVDGKAQKGTAFVRIATETVNGKVVPKLDENGKYIYLEENTDYDLTNEGVVSRPTDRFTNISKDKLELEVPESIYKAYLKAILSFEKKEILTPVKGIATGNGSESNATMPIIYWVVGEDGKLTGDYYTSTTDMPTGRYFVGYTFKTEGDIATVGYHLDGIMVNFEREEGSNDDGGNGGGGSTGGGTTGGGGTTTTTTTVTINDAGVPLAAGFDGVVIDDGAVPLAAGLDGVVIDDEGVPLADSIPQTGDNAVPVAPVAATGITALLAAFFMGKRKKED